MKEMEGKQPTRLTHKHSIFNKGHKLLFRQFRSQKPVCTPLPQWKTWISLHLFLWRPVFFSSTLAVYDGKVHSDRACNLCVYVYIHGVGLILFIHLHLTQTAEIIGVNAKRRFVQFTWKFCCFVGDRGGGAPDVMRMRGGMFCGEYG